MSTDTRHIYRGRYDRHEYWKTGVSVYFQERYNGRPISVWLAMNLAPASLLDRILKRLQEAEHAPEAVIYALGTFAFKTSLRKYAIEPGSPYLFWVYIRDDHMPNP